jgi:hypothetical protein
MKLQPTIGANSNATYNLVFAIYFSVIWLNAHW